MNKSVMQILGKVFKHPESLNRDDLDKAKSITYSEFRNIYRGNESPRGFTLAEVLITFTVVGIVAVMTVPAMIARRDRKDWMTGLSKANYMVDQAFKEAESMHGLVYYWGTNFKEFLLSGFSVSKPCDDNDCISNLKYLNKDEVPINGNMDSYILSNGQIITINVTNPECTSLVGNLDGLCGTIYVDVNGERSPNTFGKDYFGFYVTREGIIPFGSQKIGTLVDGYSWVPKGCNNGNIVCEHEYNCSNSTSSETVCRTCGGSWNVTRTDAYSEPVYAFHDAVIASGTNISAYRVDNHAADNRCGGYRCNRSCRSYYYYGYSRTCSSYRCTYACSSSYYRAAYTSTSVSSYQIVYSVDSEAYYSLDSYNFYPETYSATCPGAAAETLCLGYKYDKVWDCWQDSDGHQYIDECNAEGTASMSSCNFKAVGALDDCSLDGKGTSCASWVIMNNNMIYLDGKEVNW